MRSSFMICNVTYAASEGVVRVPLSFKCAWTCGVTIEGVDMDFWRGKREPVSPGIKLLLSANLWLPLFVTIFWYSFCQRKIWKICNTWSPRACHEKESALEKSRKLPVGDQLRSMNACSFATCMPDCLRLQIRYMIFHLILARFRCLGYLN